MSILEGASIGIDKYPDGTYALRIIMDETYNFYFAQISEFQAIEISNTENIEITDCEKPES